jgi:hypothetical protein
MTHFNFFRNLIRLSLPRATIDILQEVKIVKILSHFAISGCAVATRFSVRATFQAIPSDVEKMSLDSFMVGQQVLTG